MSLAAFWFTGLSILLATNPHSMEFIRVSESGDGFVLAESQSPLIPWGFNYDHDRTGRLIEDYWDAEWETVESDLREMKELGANVVRIHLQFAKFMEAPDQPQQSSLDQLSRLVKFAEEVQLYLDITGLGCYHKPDVPAWYDALGEQARWQAQASFWEAIAKTCAASPAVFCYDLMNEPVVPGGDNRRDDWLGPDFAGKHFVQFISLDREGRERPEIARQWIHTLVAAIRKHDPKHLITVGMVPWSLDRPGLTSGFVPQQVSDELDFISVHLYPERGKVDEALVTLQQFAEVGKPVVIEEIFPLKCDAQELDVFIRQSKEFAAGWIGFYWGQTQEELRPPKSIADAMTLGWLELFQSLTPTMTQTGQAREEPMREFRPVTCEGYYSHHLQGICTDGASLYWSFTTTLVKTDLNGQVLRQIPVANHHGDLCHHAGKLYVAVNLGKFNDPQGNADSWIYVYDSMTLKELARHEVQEVFHGAGGIGFREDRFFVVGGLPGGVQENYVYEYDMAFKFVAKHTIDSGHTYLGIQTTVFAHDRWWFGCYGSPRILLMTNSNFQLLQRVELDCSLGIEGLPDGRMLCAVGHFEKGKGYTGSIRLGTPHPETGLTIEDTPSKAQLNAAPLPK